jgi:hypothetical protein
LRPSAAIISCFYFSSKRCWILQRVTFHIQQGAVTKWEVAFHMQRENTKNFIPQSMALQLLLGPGHPQKVPLFFSVFFLSSSSYSYDLWFDPPDDILPSCLWFFH